MSNNPDKELIDLLKFQYQELGKERQRNTNIVYTLDIALVTISFFALQYFDGWLKIISPLLLFATFLIDRKLNYYNTLRAYSMENIEVQIEEWFKTKKENAEIKFPVMNVIRLYMPDYNCELPEDYKKKLSGFGKLVANIRFRDGLPILGVILLIYVLVLQGSSPSVSNQILPSHLNLSCIVN